MYRDVFYGDNADIHACMWELEEKPRAVVQIVHGIAEHAFRYHDFAEFLNRNGCLVVAEDHMGHGKSISARCPQGYFSGGWFASVADTVTLMQETMGRYPDVPYILFGHSMGSFIVRTILQEYPDSGIAGCIVCGTGWMPGLVLKTGRLISRILCKIKGETEPNALLQKLMFGSYNKKIKEPKTAYDWLSRDHRQVEAYIADPLCGFDASAGLVRDMLTGIIHIQKNDRLRNMRKDLPVYFVAGDADPVGNYGKGVLKTASVFADAGVINVFCRLFAGCRHELLNEINREEVYDDLLNWIGKIANCS